MLGEPKSLDMMGGYHEQTPQLGRHLEDTREQAQLPDKAHLGKKLFFPIFLWSTVEKKLLLIEFTIPLEEGMQTTQQQTRENTSSTQGWHWSARKLAEKPKFTQWRSDSEAL